MHSFYNLNFSIRSPFAPLACLLAGLLVSLTPCVYPLIPIYASLILKSSGKSLMRRVVLSLYYLLGLAVIFSFLGVFSSLMGKIFGFLFNYSITYIILGGVLGVLGLWSLGAISINVKGPRFSPGGSGRSFFLWGLLSAFFITPCMSPVLGGVLLFVSRGGNIFWGWLCLLFFGIGLGLPFVVLGIFSRLLDILPRPQKWQKIAEKFMGTILLLLSAAFFVKAGTLLCVCPNI